MGTFTYVYGNLRSWIFILTIKIIQSCLCQSICRKISKLFIFSPTESLILWSIMLKMIFLEKLIIFTQQFVISARIKMIFQRCLQIFIRMQLISLSMEIFQTRNQSMKSANNTVLTNQDGHITWTTSQKHTNLIELQARYMTRLILKKMLIKKMNINSQLL